MTAQKGSLVLLKIGDGGFPESFATIGGMRATQMIHNNQPVDTTRIGSGAWRELLDGAGPRAVSISGNGIFTDSSTEESVRGIAMSNALRNYRLTFGNGDVMQGAFQITSYQRAGTYSGEESFALTLASAGAISFTPA